MFYTRYIELCKKKEIAPYKVLRLLGIPSAHLKAWRDRGTIPNVYYLYDIAKYFGCRIEDLIDRERL